MECMSCVRRIVCAWIIAGLAILRITTHLVYSSDLEDRVIAFDVPSQALESGLVLYAGQAHVQMIVRAEVPKGLRTQELKGRFDARDALKTLLGKTGLTFDVTGPSTVTIHDKGR
jgi:multisubunit Na+/H+ antiporter MnhF subunit